MQRDGSNIPNYKYLGIRTLMFSPESHVFGFPFDCKKGSDKKWEPFIYFVEKGEEPIKIYNFCAFRFISHQIIQSKRVI